MTVPHHIIDALLLPFTTLVAADYEKYKNHVCRIYCYCLLFDNEKANEEKYAIAAVFHDIGIWTKNTFDYINPSIEQAAAYCNTTNKQQWLQEISLMINWHHKITPYHGPHAHTVETFRKADWTDVSLGALRFGASPKEIRIVRKAYPLLGFHQFLLKGIANNFLRHPLNPLPMFRR